MNGAWRFGYRLAFLILKMWWAVRRPRHAGALVALWHRGEVLLVRASYRKAWTLPGGGVRTGEEPADAAVRELEEELGIAWHGPLRHAVSIEEYWENRDQVVHIFEASVRQKPPLRFDNREIVEARFFHPAEIAEMKIVPPHLAAYLGFGAERRAGVPAVHAIVGIAYGGRDTNMRS